MTEFFNLRRGDAPLIVSIPHLGTEVPDSLRNGYTDAALQVADTDWHLDKLYGFASRLGATVISAKYSRYVIDLNRPSSDESLYPGQTTTGLCPTVTFRGEQVYRDGFVPNAEEKQRRVSKYWCPYHDTLADEIARLRATHPHVLLWEAHSIASVLPRLFPDKLPDLNIGTQDGRTAARQIQDAVATIAASGPYTSVLNGRFKGGFITRNFGAPASGVHAIQLEMCQSTYMNESPPFGYLPHLAAGMEPLLIKMITGALAALHELSEP